MRLAVDGLAFSYGDKPVLKDISLEVRDGESLGLMGPNGSGKTTLLRCIMNYLTPAGGSIKVDGRSLDSLSSSELARTFAVVPQASTTDFTFSAYDIVMMGRIPHMASRISAASKADALAVRKAMERTNTWQFAGRVFAGLSGGERQRVIVARAIAQQPQALLLDEPTVYLDISGQIEVMDLIRGLNKDEGITVISVLHDINLASRYCDRIALLSEGRLEAIGTPAEVLNAETIQSVYGVEVSVRKDPYTDKVYVIPHSPRSSVHRHGTRVHVLCGGGTGAPLMRLLHDHGYSVSAGVLNVLDSDYEIAKELRIPVIAEAPFASIGQDSHAQNMRLISESSAVVVSAFPVGPGNLLNLEAAKNALESGLGVYLLGRGSKSIDFVDGRADALVKELISSGAVAVADAEDLLRRLSARRGRA